MRVSIILLSVCIHVQSANNVGSGEDGRQVDNLANMVHPQATSRPRPEVTTPPLQPYFEPGLLPANSTVQLGADITLHCHVKDLAEGTKVSWLRRQGDKLSLLSVGQEKYSSEPRYSPEFRAPHDWQLGLTSARQADEGYYECQVSSHPPITQRFYLAVVVPELSILDERGLPIKVHKFYNSGSTIELKCVISKVPLVEDTPIAWRKADHLLNYDTTRGGISVKTDLIDEGVMSRLFIANANQRDSGNYSCSLADIARSSVAVVVLNGESPAAMHVSGCNYLTPSSLCWILGILFNVLSSGRWRSGTWDPRTSR